MENIPLESENKESSDQEDEEEKKRTEILNQLDFSEYIVSVCFYNSA